MTTILALATASVLVAAAAPGMSTGEWAAILVPIVVALVTGFFAYRQATKVAERNAKVEADRARTENRKASLEEYAALNDALREEIGRLRDDRREDREAHARDLARVTNELTTVQRACADQADDLHLLSVWARTVVTTLRHPDVAQALAEREVEIPPLPDPIERGRD